MKSGCGKSTAGRTIFEIIKSTSGKIIFDGKDITNLGGKELRLARKDFQMVFQDPYAIFKSKTNGG